MSTTTKLQNLHVIQVSGIGATEHLPARVKIKSERFKQTVIISYSSQDDPDYDSFAPAIFEAKKWLTNKGFNVIGTGEGTNWMYLLTDTFKPLKGK